MGKINKNEVPPGNQMKISSFFQKGAASTNNKDNSPLFSSVGQFKSKSKLGLKKKSGDVSDVPGSSFHKEKLKEISQASGEKTKPHTLNQNKPPQNTNAVPHSKVPGHVQNNNAPLEHKKDAQGLQDKPEQKVEKLQKVGFDSVGYRLGSRSEEIALKDRSNQKQPDSDTFSKSETKTESLKQERHVSSSADNNCMLSENGMDPVGYRLGSKNDRRAEKECNIDSRQKTPLKTHEDEVMVIPETQMSPAVGVDTETGRTPGGQDGNLSSDCLVVPATPEADVVGKMPARNRSFLLSSFQLKSGNPPPRRILNPKSKQNQKVPAKPMPPGSDQKNQESDSASLAVAPILISMGVPLPSLREQLASEGITDPKKNPFIAQSKKKEEKSSQKATFGVITGLKRPCAKGISPDAKRAQRIRRSSGGANRGQRAKTHLLDKFSSGQKGAAHDGECGSGKKKKKIAKIELENDNCLSDILSEMKEGSETKNLSTPRPTKVDLKSKGAISAENAIDVEMKDEINDFNSHVAGLHEKDDVLSDILNELRNDMDEGSSETKGPTTKIKPSKFMNSSKQSPFGQFKSNNEESRGCEHNMDLRAGAESKHDEMAKSVEGMDSILMGELEIEMLHDDLSNDFLKFSPFKKAEMLSSQSYVPDACPIPAEQFGRHTVTAVDIPPSRCSILLTLQRYKSEEERKCVLSGFWADTHIKVGDTVHILGEFDGSGTCHVTDSENLIIVEPDHLVSGTTVVGSMHCARRSVLNEKFKGCDSKNVHMLYGSVIHCLFQQVLQQKLYTADRIQSAAQEILKQTNILHMMYGQGVSEDSVMEEIEKYIPQILQWVEKYMAKDTSRVPSGGTVISSVADIEENIWSPRYGLKGKIDLTVEVKIHKVGKSTEKKVVPLELKTGRATHSAEHKGQVTMYCMMCGDRREAPDEGLLLYLKQNDQTTVPAQFANKRGLVQLRNELVYYLKQGMEKVDDEQYGYRYPRLPAPINNERSCSKCPQLLNCSIHLREVEKKSNGVVGRLAPEALSHLSQTHIDYYLKWCTLLHIEGAVEQRANNKDIWCKRAIKREEKGECISGLILAAGVESLPGAGSTDVIQNFQRHPNHPRGGQLTSLGVGKGDLVIISLENKTMIALGIGTITDINSRHIKVLLDRNLHDSVDSSEAVFRLDKMAGANNMGANFTNLTKLMAPEANSEKLRRLIIEKSKATFENTLSKGAIEKVKPIFKVLNKPQKAAILKALMSKDYILIKGYPGTGKTSTIVALVRILSMLGQSVLLTSYTHSAVDNILLKLKQYDLDFLRLGKLDRVHPDICPYAADTLMSGVKTVPQLTDFYQSKSIVASTCLGMSHPLFSQRGFDVCIVDEASQVLQPTCLGPLFSARRFILVGDPQQLPPLVQSQDAKDRGLSESLFQRLEGCGSCFPLHLQYRMNAEIMALSNQLIYSGALCCGNEKVAKGYLSLPDKTHIHTGDTWIRDALDTSEGHAVVFLNTEKVAAEESKEGHSVKNAKEGEIVAKLTSVLLKAGCPAGDIGVITPYRGQVQFVQGLLRGQGAHQVEVNTIDQYQGRDKAVIILSFVRSSTQKSETLGTEILHDMARLNVAITRAKHKMILVGHMTSLHRYPPVHRLLEILQPQQICVIDT